MNYFIIISVATLVVIAYIHYYGIKSTINPLYYQKHKGLKYFEPWTYKVLDKPVVGWCSWFAYWNKVTEDDIKKTADIVSEEKP